MGYSLQTMQGITLNADGIVLRPWRVADAAWYVAARDEEIYRWTTESRALTVAETEQAIRYYLDAESFWCFAIADGQTDQLMGNLALEVLAPDFTTGEGHYWLAEQARGRGVATTALKLLSEWAFADLKLQRLFLKIMPGNLRSQRVAETVGFHRIETPTNEGSSGVWVWFALNKADLVTRKSA